MMSWISARNTYINPRVDSYLTNQVVINPYLAINPYPINPYPYAAKSIFQIETFGQAVWRPLANNNPT